MEVAIEASCLCKATESWQLGNEGKQDCKGQEEMTKSCSRGEITLVCKQSGRNTEGKYKGIEDVGREVNGMY